MGQIKNIKLHIVTDIKSAMEVHERKKTREEKSRKKSRAEKCTDYTEKLLHRHIPPPPLSGTITMTTSTYPEDSEYTDIAKHPHKSDYRRRERSQQKTTHEQDRHRSKSEEHRKEGAEFKNVQQGEESEEEEDEREEDFEGVEDEGSSREENSKEENDEGRVAVVGRLERVVTNNTV